MPTRIERAVLPVSDRVQLRYATSRGSAAPSGAAPLLVCLHPGWNGETPPAFFGSEFLTALFLPAFGTTGAIVAGPDCPSGAWNNETSRTAVLALIDHLVTTAAADPRRISLAGYSAGGWGVWYLLRHDADRFASAVILAAPPVIDPVEAFIDNVPKTAEALSGRLDEWINGIPDIPITIIHSQDDELLRWEESRAASEALAQAGRRVELRLIQGVGHFESPGYVPALAASSDWLVQTWAPTKREAR